MSSVRFFRQLAVPMYSCGFRETRIVGVKCFAEDHNTMTPARAHPHLSFCRAGLFESRLALTQD